MKYKVSTRDASGIEAVHTLEGETPEIAMQQVDDMGLFPMECTPVVEDADVEEGDPIEYPGPWRLVTRWFKSAAKEAVLAVIAGAAIACIVYFLGRLFTFNPTFWGVQRFAISALVVFAVGLSIVRQLILLPLCILAYSKDWDVPYRVAQAAILGGITENRSRQELEAMTADDIEKFLWLNRMAETFATTVMGAMKKKGFR